MLLVVVDVVFLISREVRRVVVVAAGCSGRAAVVSSRGWYSLFAVGEHDNDNSGADDFVKLLRLVGVDPTTDAATKTTTTHVVVVATCFLLPAVTTIIVPL